MFQIEISLKFTLNHGPVSPSNFFSLLSFLSFLSSQGGIKLGWQNSEQLADIGLLVRTIVRSFTSCGRSFRHHICCFCSDESTLSFIDLVITHLTHPWGPPWTLETLGGPWRPLATLGDMLENDHFQAWSPRVAKGRQRSPRVSKVQGGPQGWVSYNQIDHILVMFLHDIQNRAISPLKFP